MHTGLRAIILVQGLILQRPIRWVLLPNYFDVTRLGPRNWCTCAGRLIPRVDNAFVANLRSTQTCKNNNMKIHSHGDASRRKNSSILPNADEERCWSAQSAWGEDQNNLSRQTTSSCSPYNTRSRSNPKQSLNVKCQHAFQN